MSDQIIDILRKKLLEQSLCKQSLEQVKFLLKDYENLHFSVSCLTQIIKNEDVNNQVFLKHILEQIEILFKQQDYYFRSTAVDLLALIVLRHKKLLKNTEILLNDMKEDCLLIHKEVERLYKEVELQIKKYKDKNYSNTIEDYELNRLYEELQLKVNISYKKLELKIKEDKDYLLIHIEFEKLYIKMSKEKDTLVKNNFYLLQRAKVKRT